MDEVFSKGLEGLVLKDVKVTYGLSYVFKV